MKVVAIVQARMGSTRLPGKVLLDIGGHTVLGLCLLRMRRARLLDRTVVATSTNAGDDAIIELCEREGVGVFRGSEDDVLDRYYHAARAFSADAVVRVTSDCPLIDPQEVDRVVAAFLDGQPDYACNILVRTFPRGLDVEVMTLAALERAWRDAAKPYERAHVTPYIRENPSLFRHVSLTADRDYFSVYRLTIDTADDLKMVRALYDRLERDEASTWPDMLRVLEGDPDLVAINRHVEQKALHEG